MTCPVWIYDPSMPPWRGAEVWVGGSRTELHQGSWSPVTAQSPVTSQAASERWPCSRPGLSCPSRAAGTQQPVQAQVFQASLLLAGFSRLFPVPGPAWTDMWGQAHTAAAGNVGVERASRNERPAGRGEGCQGGSLITGLSVLISHGAWARTSLRPFTRHWGPDTRGPPSLGHHGRVNQGGK